MKRYIYFFMRICNSYQFIVSNLLNQDKIILQSSQFYDVTEDARTGRTTSETLENDSQIRQIVRFMLLES